jgi:ubiquinone biosynthesis protein
MKTRENTTPPVKNDTRHFGRYREITSILFKYRMGELIHTLDLERFMPLRWVPPGNPWHKEEFTRSQRTRMALEELGTTFVKMGQILASRGDIVPSDVVHELAKLHDSLTPLPQETIESVIQTELGRPVKEIFSSFEPKPIGVASIGQVHAATLQDGTAVVIKVQKPGVQKLVREDLEIMRQMAASGAKNESNWRHYDLTGLVEEIKDTLNGEMDYLREGHSAEHFARFFQDDPTIHIPKIYWNLTTPRVITMERIRGIGILDLTSLDAAGVDRKALAKRVAGIWIDLVFHNPVFHADPHPGNLFLEPDGRLALLDFGMIGSVDDEVRSYLVNVVKGILDRDADLVMDSLVDLGAVTPSGAREPLRKDLKHIMGHYPLISDGLNLTSNLGEIFSVIRRNYVQLPGNSFLVLKTMSMAQSLGQALDPSFDFFGQMIPIVDNLLKKKYQPSSIIRRLPPAFAELALFGAGLPLRLARIVKSIERGDLRINADVSGVERHLEHLERLVNRAIIGLIIAFAILSAAIVILAFKLAG